MTNAAKKQTVKHVWEHPIFDGKADPERVSAELERVRAANEDESLLPEAVVEYARAHPRSELHKLFPWDDAEAAEKFRRDLARQIVRSIRVIYEDESTEPQRLYVRPATESGYQPIRGLTRESQLSLRRKALQDLVAWSKRYEDLARQTPAIKTTVDDLISLVRQDIEERPQ